MNFNSLKIKAAGLSVGHEWSLEKFSPYIEFQMNFNDDDGFKYKTINFGARLPLITKTKFTFGLDVEGGLGSVDIKNSRNEFSFLSSGVGAFVNFNITQNISLFLNSKYMFYTEISGDIKCNDDPRPHNIPPDDIGSRLCPYYGVITPQQQDKIGNASGLKLSLGLKFSF